MQVKPASPINCKLFFTAKEYATLNSQIMKKRGFTLIETMLVLAIIGVLGGVFMLSLTGLKGGDSIDRGAQSIYDDLIFIRGRAISANQNHRLNFYSTSAWALQAFNGTTWSNISTNRTMPTSTFLTNTSQANASTNIEATPRGLYSFNNSATGTPYVVISGTGTSKTKSINLYVGGAIELQTP